MQTSIVQPMELAQFNNFVKKIYLQNNLITPENQIGDKYDQYSIHLWTKNDQILATLRLTPHNPLGFPLESNYNITELKQNNIIEISHRTSINIKANLQILKASYQYALKNNITHIIAAAHPQKNKTLICFGFKKLNKITTYKNANNNIADLFTLELNKSNNKYAKLLSIPDPNIYI